MKAPAKPNHVQYGALPYRVLKDGSMQVLLVTSRHNRRWIIPKGGPMKDRAPAESAEREAYEEAGVRGEIGPKSIGCFTYEKGLDDGDAVPCEVRVFPLRVDRQLSTWPEHREREVRWLDRDEAREAVEEPSLKELIGGFRPQIAKKTKRSGS